MPSLSAVSPRRFTSRPQRGTRARVPRSFASAMARAPASALAALALAGLAGTAHAQETHLYWGDTHVHTSYSTDAYASGNMTIDPDTAYRFAKGHTVLHPMLSTRTRIERPLDFLIVSDRSDFLGAQVYISREDPRLADSEEGRRLQAFVRSSPGAIFALAAGSSSTISPEDALDAYRPMMRRAWLEEVAAAERHYEPGSFTTFAGWEWSADQESRALHRVVFSPAPAQALGSFFPFSALESNRPEDLWAWLETTSAATGADFIAIPHHSNMSDGLMFPDTDEDRPLTAEDARRRARWEPVAEIVQTRGASEAHPELSPDDPFAGHEIFRRLFFAKEPEPHEGDYARSALLRGLEIEARIGVNPYKFGMVGGSDVSTGLPQIEESDFGGAAARNVLPEVRAAAAASERAPDAAATLDAWELSAAGLTGVWAQENTREGIAAAFKRREVYATSGPRITLQVFASFRFFLADAQARNIAAAGYARGVPMGGDLARAPPGGRPRLLVRATRDPDGANLDRIQVIKGWLDAEGKAHERVYTVAWAGERALDEDGELPPVGDTVDLEGATYENTIGAEELTAVWEDPAFDPDQPAFYYVRVLEIPTPRHHVYDAAALGMDAEEIPLPSRIQERAWSSPIWYSPKPDRVLR